MKLTRHEINANLPKRTFLVTLINANFKHIIFSDHPFSLKNAEYHTKNTAVIEWIAKIHDITPFLSNSILITQFSPKMTYFDQIDPINDIFDQFYVHKPETFRNNFFTNIPKFWLMTSFLPPKWLDFDHFHQKWPTLRHEINAAWN